MRTTNWGLFARRLLLCSAGLMLIGLCSCAHYQRKAFDSARHLRGAERTDTGTTSAQAPPYRATANPSDVQSVRMPGPNGMIEPISYQVPVEEDGFPRGHYMPPQMPVFPPGACPPGYPGATAHPGAMMPMPIGPGAYAPLIAPATGPELFPDEYLCDGGDGGLPIHYSRFHRMGLETEDAVAEFVDSAGEFRVKPTNKVCVYAPRFAAVRTISSPVSGIRVEQLASAQDVARGIGMKSEVASNMHLRNTPPIGMRVRSRASGMEAEAVGVGVHQRTRLALHARLTNAYEDISFFKTGQFIRSEEAWLAYGIQAARVWTRIQSPYIVGQVEGAREIRASFIPQELVGVEDKKAPGELRIVKLADKKTAKPGDVITFTIRYDNLGDLPLHHIRIVDNLTPRLQYIEGSASSDLPGELFTEDNEEGSLILHFVLDDPLPGRTGGVLTFQTEVR